MNQSGNKTEHFHVVGISSHTDALKKLASLNPEWQLSPEEIVASGRADQKIYKLKFVNKPVALQKDPATGALNVLVSGEHVGHIQPSETPRVKEIIKNYEIQNVACGIWGGQYKTVDEFYGVETQQQGLSITLRLTYKDLADSLDDDLLSIPIEEEQSAKPSMVKEAVKAEKKEKPKKKKAKKSIFKRWWFWVIIALFLLDSCNGGSESTIEPLPSAETSSIPSQDETTSYIETTETEAPTSVATLPEDSAPIGEKNALRSALSYLKYSSFSYTGLISQLEYEGYTPEEAAYAADNCGADWYAEATESAESYLKYSAFSYTGLIEQLEYEGFTAEQAVYGVDSCDADWFAEAAESAESYLKYSSFSRSGLIEQLEYEGFTSEQAVYGVEQNGY